ncbi:MAG: hypothetical protein ACE5JX_23215 [Acidobacteriota bacterium]
MGLEQEKAADVWEKAFRISCVSGLIALALVAPPYSYLVWPHYQSSYRRERIVLVEDDHDYFGAI